ncbi:hypothetical protein VSR01_17480 [Actinacidiphila sp. DG2A-62]|uniref:hypothetical protein n=1 Tax=Actinacidiphila sp. DG2A-62 TaxID=3108821 RepID=UPI002DBAA421|nr:hypothetical protein [Actinacidiphila sp. DG2A-62]MEC3995231.1 hypothetical protein [Actinacidiphila sp. DG2A-62]
MTNEQQDTGRAPGCPPHEFGNALAWKWTRDMPTSLKGGFLTTLYAMRAMASASGQLRFSGDGKPIRIQDIAKASGCREKDARRYLEAAIRAGVVAVIGERRRGKPTLYMLVNCPWPGWEAAAHYLKETARPKKSDDGESSGHSGPNSEGDPEDGSSGHSGPNLDADLDDEVRATAARMGSGHSGPNGSGHSGPNNPGSTQELPQEMAGVVPQPQERAGERGEDDSPERQETTATAARPGGLENGAADVAVKFCECGQRILRPDRDQCGGCLRKEAEAAKARKAAAEKPVQGTFLLPLAGGGQGAPQSRRERPQWPAEDPTAPLRVCGCGRKHRLRNSDLCPDCVYAADQQRAELGSVSSA